MLVILVSATLIGLSLGLLGSGGAILTVPALIYGVGMSEKEAIASALLIVALISLFSSFANIKNKQIVWSNITAFLIPSVLGSYLGALAGSYVDGYLQLACFAVIMFLAGINTLTRKKNPNGANASHIKVMSIGLGVGLITGFVGVGGGFLIVPALIILMNLPMRNAVATSLILISVNSLMAFARYAISFNRESTEFNWFVIITFALIGTFGSYLGQFLAKKMNPAIIQTGFACLLIGLAVFTFYQAAIQF